MISRATPLLGPVLDCMCESSQHQSIDIYLALFQGYMLVHISSISMVTCKHYCKHLTWGPLKHAGVPYSWCWSAHRTSASCKHAGDGHKEYHNQAYPNSIFCAAAGSHVNSLVKLTSKDLIDAGLGGDVVHLVIQWLIIDRPVVNGDLALHPQATSSRLQAHIMQDSSAAGSIKLGLRELHR